MSDDSSQEEKQNFLRENILEQGYDTGMFVDFLISKKGEGGADVGNWSMSDLQIVVREFISMQSNDYNLPPEQPIINNNPTPTRVQNDPLTMPKPISISNDPLSMPKVKVQNDPLQNTQPPVKKSAKFDPLSGGVTQTKEPAKKQTSSMASFFSNNNPSQKPVTNINTMPQIQPQINPQINAQLNPQMNFYNQAAFQQNQFNPQFQNNMIQNQFPQFMIQNQQVQNNIQTQNVNNVQTQQKINQEVKQQVAQPQKNVQVNPVPDAQNKNIPPSSVPQPQADGKSSPKDDQGILYGIIISPSEEAKFVDKTPLGISDNPNIQVGFPEKVEGGFFSKSYVTYLITTSPLNIKVRRRYSDFDWLRQILCNLYVGNVIPTTPRKNKIGSDKFGDAFLQKRMRTLEKFLNYLLMNPVIKYSQIFFDFISIENEADFNKKKKEYEKMKPSQNVNDNQTLNGRIEIEVKKEKETYFENIKDNITYNETLLTKLNENIKLLKVQMENLTLKIDEIAQIWSELSKTSAKYFDTNEIIQTYEQMGKLFTNWSDALKRHNNVIHVDIREYFKYIKNTFRAMKDLVYVVDSNKNTYYKNERYLINKKEDLFRKGDPNKWELDLNDKDNATKLLQDKSSALMKIIPKETNNVIGLKKVYGYYLNRIISEYERIKFINTSFHPKNLVNACEKITEIYADFQKGSSEIISFFNSKNSIPNNIGSVNNPQV
jgi:sorting nexin-7/30/sorting nexin-8